MMLDAATCAASALWHLLLPTLSSPPCADICPPTAPPPQAQSTSSDLSGQVAMLEAANHQMGMQVAGAELKLKHQQVGVGAWGQTWRLLRCWRAVAGLLQG